MDNPITDLYSPVEQGKVAGYWRALQLLQQALADNFNIEQRTHWLLIWKEPISHVPNPMSLLVNTHDSYN